MTDKRLTRKEYNLRRTEKDAEEIEHLIREVRQDTCAYLLQQLHLALERARREYRFREEAQLDIQFHCSNACTQKGWLPRTF